MSATTSNPQYDEPPVRSVVLTVYYAPVHDFGLPLALELAKLWADRYPAITQDALRPRPPEVPGTSPFEGNEWPFPRVVQTDNTLSRAISYQFDQLSLRWTFDGGVQANKYPGFQALFLELQSAYEQFVQSVDKLSESGISVQACGCEYVNNFDEISPESWVAGYVSNWQMSISPELITSGDDKVFFRFSGRSNEVSMNVETKFAIQVSRRKPRGSSIRIRASALPLPSEGEIIRGNELMDTLMEHAHDALIDTFESASDDSMKKRWSKRGSLS